MCLSAMGEGLIELGAYRAKLLSACHAMLLSLQSHGAVYHQQAAKKYHSRGKGFELSERWPFP